MSLDLRKIVEENPLLAIMRNVPLEQTLDYVKAAMDGGVRFFEVALNSPHALEQIFMLRREFAGQALIGAGTAITVEKAAGAVEAGAQFLLSPSTDLDVMDYCQKNGIALMPGALTPSDVSSCLRYGFSTIKLSPPGICPGGTSKVSRARWTVRNMWPLAVSIRIICRTFSARAIWASGWAAA